MTGNRECLIAKFQYFKFNYIAYNFSQIYNYYFDKNYLKGG